MYNSKFLNEEIQKDLDLVERHIEKVEKELLENNYSKQFVHLYETYERLLRVYNNNKSLKDCTKSELDFYIKRRDILQSIRNKMRVELGFLFDGDRKTYKKLIFTYENIISKYKELYNGVRNIQITMIKNINLLKVHEIKYIEIKDHETATEIVNYYNNSFSRTLSGKFSNFNYTELKIVYDNSMELGFLLQNKFIPIELNEKTEFDIVLK